VAPLTLIGHAKSARRRWGSLDNGPSEVVAAAAQLALIALSAPARTAGACRHGQRKLIRMRGVAPHIPEAAAGSGREGPTPQRGAAGCRHRSGSGRDPEHHDSPPSRRLPLADVEPRQRGGHCL